MKFTVLGGASFSTPALFQALQGNFAGSEFVLVARSAEHLHSVARAAKVLAGIQAPKITPIVCEPQTSAAALEGAAVVLIQMRIGNMSGRGLDESFPLQFGLCGDEGLGPGGVSAAWRSWPTMERWLQAIREHAPTALVLMMSSPVGILTRAAHVRFPELNCLGICEVPYVALKELTALLQVDLKSAIFEYLGVNHLGWFHTVRSNGRDLMREWAESPGRLGFPSLDLIRKWDGIPTKYLRLHFEPDAVLSSQQIASISRAQELQTLQESALAQYATASESQLQQLLARRRAPWYALSIVPLLRGLIEGESPVPFFLSGPNQRHHADFAADDILEMGCRVTGGAIKHIPSIIPPPQRIAELVLQFCRHERLATKAVLRRQVPLLETALRAHPWVARAAASHNDLPARLAETIISCQGD